MLGKRICIVDDEESVCELLKYNLSKDGYIVRTFNNPAEAIMDIHEFIPSLIVTDWLMPEMDGLDFCKYLKRNPETQSIPVIMLSCKSDEVDIVTALEVGVEDYLVKPLKIKELVTRIKKILTRVPFFNTAAAHLNFFDKKIYTDLIINTEKHVALLYNKPINLTYSEFRLLELFVNKPDKVFSRSDIIENEYGHNGYVSERAVDVKIVNLRKKLGQQGKRIQTIRSVGYKYSETI